MSTGYSSSCMHVNIYLIVLQYGGEGVMLIKSESLPIEVRLYHANTISTERYVP